MEEAQSLRQLYGLDRPVYVQYGKWMARVLVGDFGESMEWRRPVVEVIGDRLWLTVVLSFAALLLTWGLAFPIGIYSAVRQYSVLDYVFTAIGFIGLAVPNFLLALVIMYFSFKLFGANVGGLFSPEFDLAPWSWAKVWDLMKHLPLPALILALAGTAQLIRIMRGNLLEILGQQFVTTARAKGLPERTVVNKYAVRVAINPLISVMGLQLPNLIGGATILGIVLSLPTTGPLFLRALINQDIYLAGTFLLMLSALLMLGNLLADLTLAWADPRIRYV
jgi:peptide/nickel transport system permease protein